MKLDWVPVVGSLLAGTNNIEGKLAVLYDERELLWDEIYDAARRQVVGRHVGKSFARRLNVEYLGVLKLIADLEGNDGEIFYLRGLERVLNEGVTKAPFRERE
ncbi:MAG: hypothetical protein M1607_05195 [Patescibacteria group bacterium]|nr:hypothetical protein [Patescibacteria group bacterium]